MIFGGIQKTSLIDYPGRISTVIFTRGCNFRCFYCHNPELVYPHLYKDEIPFTNIFDFINKRRNIINSIVVTGGEPTIHNDILDILSFLKNENFFIKLDTNGSNPEVIYKIIKSKVVDYIAMDIKTSFEKYYDVIRVSIDTNLIKESIDLILKSNINYEFRTTYDNKFITFNDIDKIKSYLPCDTNYNLQKILVHKKEREQNE